MRGIGSVMVLLGSMGMALRYVLLAKRNVQIIEELRDALELIEGEIRYGRHSLPECFLKVGMQRRTRIGKAFEAIGNRMAYSGGLILREGMEQELGPEIRQALPKEEYQAFFDFAAPGGYAGDEMQRKALERSRNRLEALLLQRRKELGGKCRVAWCLGVTGGAFLILLLW